MRNPFRLLYKGPRRLRRWMRRQKQAALYCLTTAGLWIVGRLSLDHALRLGERVGGLAYRLLRKRRRLSHEHIRMVFGDTLTAAAREHLARGSFVNLARCFCELAQIEAIRNRAPGYVEMEGREHLQACLRQGMGAIVVTGYLGNWELLAAYCGWEGFPIALMARRIYARRLHRLLVDFRSRQGVETILRESPQSARQIGRALTAHALLAVLIDQNTRVQSIALPFFGRLARTPAAAASLAIRRDLPAVTAFIQRRPGGGHRITISPPFDIARTGDTKADIRALTRKFTAALEAQVRRNPAEWMWWHRPWRRARTAQLDPDRDSNYKTVYAVLRGGG